MHDRMHDCMHGFTTALFPSRKTTLQTLFAQLYVNSDRQRNLEYIRKLEAGGVTALFITVDAPALGRREKDMRMTVR